MNKNVYLGVFIISLSLLSGCSSRPEKVDNIDYEKIIIDNRKELRENIIEVAEKAYAIQKTIAAVNNAMALQSEDFSPEVMRYVEFQSSYIPQGMEREMSITWKAYPEELLKLLANASDYQIEFLGKKSPIGRVVNIDPNPRNIKRLIDDIELQSKDYIYKIDIFEESKLIKVYYTQ